MSPEELEGRKRKILGLAALLALHIAYLPDPDRVTIAQGVFDYLCSRSVVPEKSF